MLHYEVPPEKLQSFVPYPLDLREGKAYVSLVAFTMRRLRPRRGGRLAAFAFRPIASHELLNVRTYVRHNGVAGIYFLAEWIPNLFSVPLGRLVFGLPYRPGKLRYLHEHEGCLLYGEVRSWKGRGRLRYRAKLCPNTPFLPSKKDSLTEWLMERYTAFTAWHGWKRCFRVRHEPWPQCEVKVEVLEDSLLDLTGSWARYARLIGANYSPGVWQVEMSAAQKVHPAPRCKQLPKKINS